MKKQYDDDDGRTIADMSDVSRDNLLIPRMPPSREERLRREREEQAERAGEQGRNPYPNSEMSSEERKSYIFGAMSAGLLIALCFVVGFLIVILLMLLVWNH